MPPHNNDTSHITTRHTLDGHTRLTKDTHMGDVHTQPYTHTHSSTLPLTLRVRFPTHTRTHTAIPTHFGSTHTHTYTHTLGNRRVCPVSGARLPPDRPLHGNGQISLV